MLEAIVSFISRNIAIIALCISLFSLYITIQRYMRDKPSYDLKVISSEHISERGSEDNLSILRMLVQITNTGYVATTIIEKKFIIDGREYEAYLIDGGGNKSEHEYLKLPERGAVLVLLEAKVSIPSNKTILGNLVVKDVYKQKRTKITSKPKRVDKILDLSSGGYINEFRGYRFKAEHISYDKYHTTKGLILNVEKPNGTESTIVSTHITLKNPVVIDNIKIELVEINEIDSVTSGQIAVTEL